MDLNSSVYNSTFLNNKFTKHWVDVFRHALISSPQDLPEIILILSLVCIVGAFLNRYWKDFPISPPVILFLIGCSFEILSFTSYKVQRYADAIQWMDPNLFFDLFTPIIIFTTAFGMDIYMLQKLFWQILLITGPGFFINYTLILWHLASVNIVNLKITSWLLFSAILVSSDPMLTAAALRNLGLPRGLTNLIIGESLITSVMSFIVFTSILDTNSDLKKIGYSFARSIMKQTLFYYIASFSSGIINSKLYQLWASTVFDDDGNHISLSFSMLYLIFFICKFSGMSGIFTLAIMGLFLNSKSFKPETEKLLLQFWNSLSFVALIIVFTFTGLLIPAHTYLYTSFSDIYYSLNIFFTLIVLRLLVFLLISSLLSRLGDELSWRSAFIIVCSEMRGVPNINMAVLLAYSDLPLGTEREKSQILFHGMSVFLLTLIANRIILPMAVSKLGLGDTTSTKYKSLYYTFQHFQEIIKSAASSLKLDKDLANADWSMVEKAILFQNPYVLRQRETTEHQKVNCPKCNEEIDETLNIEAVQLANRHLSSAQIASYQRQYRNEILSQSAVQMLIGAAGSLGEKGDYMDPETLKNYSESKKIIRFIRKVLLNLMYNTKREEEVSSGSLLLHIAHKIVFTEEFEYVGYLVVLMNMFFIIISWMPNLGQIYENELKYSYYFFIAFYILEALFKITVMRKEYFLQTWNTFELVITLVGIIDIIVPEGIFTYSTLDLIEIFFKIIGLLRILRLIKLVAPKLLQFIDERMSLQLSFRYAILKGYIQGETDILSIIDQISSSERVKQMLLRRITRNMVNAMKELGYLEYDRPEIAVTMKTKEEINVMLILAKEIVKVCKLTGIFEIEASEINRLIMAKKRDLLDFQPIIKPLTIAEALYHIPWLDKNKDHISFIQEGTKFVTFDCGNIIFKEDDEPQGIYVIISGMIKLQKSKPDLVIDQMLCKSEEKDHQMPFTDYVISGEIIGELNCLINEPMKYSATCKTVVEACFIPKNHLYDAFENCCPQIEYKMWLRLGLSITAQKLKEHLSYEDWTYKLQINLYNVYVKDIPKNIKTDIYDETVIYIVLIHGAVEDCQLRKTYQAPFVIPLTCHQMQGTEDFTKLMIVQTSLDEEKFRWETRKDDPSRKPSGSEASVSSKHYRSGYGCSVHDPSTSPPWAETVSKDLITQ
ncbi:solute carrier family 9 member C1 [Saccopteryx bilineata]|uniref:solute carrier family 9 member C1 n=1 Tax=Saccopteryx bilineata TaxID=59482 RepID=UPI00338E3558